MQFGSYLIGAKTCKKCTKTFCSNCTFDNYCKVDKTVVEFIPVSDSIQEILFQDHMTY